MAFPANSSSNHSAKVRQALALLILFSPSLTISQSLSPGLAAVTGTIRDAHHQPSPNISIYLQSEAGTQTQTTHSDLEGKYAFSKLPPGTYKLQIASPVSGEVVATLFPLAPDEIKTVDLILATKPPVSAQSARESLDFFDPLQFTEAGVRDDTAGSHGSNSTVRTSHALTQQTAALAEADFRNPPARSTDSVDTLQKFQQAADREPSESNIFDLGANLLLHGAMRPAIEVFSNGTRLFPNSVRILSGLGAALFANGSYSEAVQRLCEASDLDPMSKIPYLFLGEIEEARVIVSDRTTEKLKRFVTLQPENARANYYYAVTLWQQYQAAGVDLAQVETLLQKSIQRDPNFAPAYLHLGIFYSDRGDFPKAISAYKSAIKISPRLGEAHYRLSQAYRRSSDATGAQQELTRYQELSRQNEPEIEGPDIQEFVHTSSDPHTIATPR